MKNGFLIAVEGIDGAGKTTQVGLLEEFLRSRGVDVVRSKEPTDGPWGRKIRESATSGRLSLEDELAAFIEDRREHVRDVIRPALDAGKTVILDRYFYSTIAYQGVRGANRLAVERQMIDEFPIPNIVLLLDVHEEVGLQRVRAGRGEVPNAFEQADTLRRCRDVFLMTAWQSSNFVIVDGDQSIEDVRNEITGHIALNRGISQTQTQPTL